MPPKKDKNTKKAEKDAKKAAKGDAKEVFAAKLTALISDEKGGDDGFDAEGLESAGGIACIVEMAVEEVKTSMKREDGSIFQWSGEGLWDLAPDACEMLKDAGGSAEIMQTVADRAGEALALLIEKLALGFKYEAGKHCIAILKTDGQWHEAVIVASPGDNATGDELIMRVKFNQFGNEEDVEVSDVRLPAGGGKETTCPLCDREMPLGPYLLIPKSQHAKLKKKGSTVAELEKTVQMCVPCRAACSKAEDDTKLASDYNTLEALKAHPEVVRFVEWAANEKAAVGKAGSYSQ